MSKELHAIDISHTPELRRIAEEVRRTRQPRVLRHKGEDLAMLVPLPPTQTASSRARTRTFTEEDDRAFLASAGGWKEVDTDRFLADNAASRRASTRPPVEL